MPRPPFGKSSHGVTSIRVFSRVDSVRRIRYVESERSDERSLDRGGRLSPRIRGYDYAQEGVYFVPYARWHCLFGSVEGGRTNLSAPGSVAVQCWTGIPVHFPGVELDEFVVMPNHVHRLLNIAHDHCRTIGSVWRHVDCDNRGGIQGCSHPRNSRAGRFWWSACVATQLLRPCAAQ